VFSQSATQTSNKFTTTYIGYSAKKSDQWFEINLYQQTLEELKRDKSPPQANV
jgi:hypothetical protein